jgi:GT2 family glycosyltransferase
MGPGPDSLLRPMDQRDDVEADLPDPADPDAVIRGYADDVEPAAPPLPVLAVVVASGLAVGLEATLASLRKQTFEPLAVLVVDSGCDHDPTPRVAAEMPGAYVRRAEGDRNAARAANSVIGTIEGVWYLLFCRPGTVVEPDAVRLLVEEAYRSNAAIVGPKVVDTTHPDVLLEVGMSIDHYGVPFSGIEPDEIDQEQHDAVRDVFFVSSTAMLVRADLFIELGGFDPEEYPGVADVDLCWRARLAGGRVLAVPDARVRHEREAHAFEVTRAHGELGSDVFRNRLRLLLKCYSGATLLWVLPVALFLNVLESGAFLFTRDRRRARYALGAWFAIARRMSGTLQARRAVQSERRVDDRDIRDLMIRGSSRVRTFVHNRLHAGDRIQEISLSAQRATVDARRRVTQGQVTTAIVIAAVLLFGSRSLVFDGVPEVGTFVRWPGWSQLLSAFWSPWRFAGLGRAAPAPAAFGILTVWSVPFLGHTALAQTTLVVLALPVGGLAIYRLVRPLSASWLPPIAAAVAYLANPVARNLVASAELGPLVTYALGPFVVALCLRAERVAPGSIEGRRTLVATAALVAVLAAMWPPAGLFAVAVALAVLLAAALDGRIAGAARVGGLALLATAGAAVLLAPWIGSVVGGDAASLGLATRDPYPVSRLLRFGVGPHGTGLASWGLYVTALVPLFASTGARWRWAVRGWAFLVVSCLLAYLPSRLSATAAVPSYGGVLVLGAIGLAIAVSAAAGVVTDELRRSRFGWRQPTALAALLGLALPIAVTLSDSIEGDWRLPNHDWHDSLVWMDQLDDGDFRVLWIGAPEVLPLSGRTVAGTAWAMSRNGTGDVRDLWPSPGDRATTIVDQAVALVAADRTPRFGRLVGPMGVRYVALVDRAAPGSGHRRPAEPRLADALAKQIDLAVVRTQRGMTLYENQAWTPALAVVPAGSAAVPAGRDVDPISAALRSDPSARPIIGSRRHTPAVGPGTVLWAESYDARWRARAAGRRLPQVTPYGWSNGWDLREHASVSITYAAPIGRRLLVFLQVALWALVAAFLWVTRTRGRARRADSGDPS